MLNYLPHRYVKRRIVAIVTVILIFLVIYKRSQDSLLSDSRELEPGADWFEDMTYMSTMAYDESDKGWKYNDDTIQEEIDTAKKTVGSEHVIIEPDEEIQGQESEQHFKDKESNNEQPFKNKESNNQKPFKNNESNNEQSFKNSESNNEQPFKNKESNNEKDYKVNSNFEKKDQGQFEKEAKAILGTIDRAKYSDKRHPEGKPEHNHKSDHAIAKIIPLHRSGKIKNKINELQSLLSLIGKGAKSRYRDLSNGDPFPKSIRNLYSDQQPETQERVGKSSNSSKKYFIFCTDLYIGELVNVIDVFESSGFQRTYDIEDDWDVLWAYYFKKSHFLKMVEEFDKVGVNQKMNNFPGLELMFQKDQLSTLELPYIPRSFKMTSQLNEMLEYARANPVKHFVQKLNYHHGIQLRDVLKPGARFKKNLFIQEFVADPFLIEGYKFDIGVHVVITSVNPLRLYVYDKDIILRLGGEKYHPFDPYNLQKYVIRNVEEYDVLLKVPEIKPIYEAGDLNVKALLNHYLKSKGRDPQETWDYVHKIIKDLFLHQEDNILQAFETIQSKRSFFELLRLDFIFDSSAKAYLMEVNRSSFLGNVKVKHKILKNKEVVNATLHLAGLFDNVDPDQPGFQGQVCSDMQCQGSCSLTQCNLCHHCLDPESRVILATAEMEAKYREDFQRVHPRPFKSPAEVKATLEEDLAGVRSAEDQLMHRWYAQRCLADDMWCSR